jgi:hypothetical protein
MARGQIAKDNLTKLIVDALGDKVVAIQDKKIYVNMDDGGEMVQVAISMTVPKTPIAAAAQSTGTAGGEYTSAPTKVELSPEDKAKVNELMQKLGFAT